MSFQAMTWAAQQSCGSPSAKLVLLCLANFASSETGVCWPSQSRLAKEAEQSVDTVQRRLRELQAKGLIFRVKQRTARHAHFTTDRIVLLMDDAARAEALALGWDPEAAAAGDEAPGAADAEAPAAAHDPAGAAENSTVPQSAVPQIAARSVPQIAAPSVPHCCGTEQEVINPSPLNPPETLVAPANRPAAALGTPVTPVGSRGALPAAPTPAGDWRPVWDRFEALWPWPPTTPREPSRRAFQRLTAAERELAVTHAPAYLAERRRSSKGSGGRSLFDARRYFRDRAWEPWASGTATQAAKPSRVAIIKGTRAWDAWVAYYAAQDYGPPTEDWVTVEGKRCLGCVRDTLFPPPVPDLNGARPFIRADSAEWAAWQAWRKAQGEPPLIVQSRLRYGCVTIRGGFVPTRWPPAHAPPDAGAPVDLPPGTVF